MAEPVSWIAVAIAVISLIDGISQRISRRRESADKMDFEFKMKALEMGAEKKDARLTEMQKQLDDCRKQHAESEADRKRLWDELESLKKAKEEE